MPSNIQVQQIRPDFSGSNATRAQASDSLMKAYRYPGEMLDRLDKQQALAKEEQRYQEGKLFQKEQADRQAQQWEKSFLLQQNADDRAKAEQLAKENTRQAYGQFGELATAPNQTQAQVADIMKEGGLLQKAQKEGRVLTAAEEGKLLAQVNADLNKNKGSLTQQRQVLLEQGPVSELYDVVKDPVTGVETVRTRSDIDTSSQQDYKGKLLDNLDRRIGDEARLAQDASQFKANYKLKLRELNDKAKTGEFKQYTVTVGFDSNGQPTADPSKMAHKSNILITRPDQEAAVQRKYGNAIQLGTVTDYVPNTTGAGKYKDVKSIYSSPELTALAEKAGGTDSDRLMKPLGELQNRYKGILTPGELVNIGMTSTTDRGIWGDTSVNMQLMKNQVRDAILDNPKNKDDFNTVDRAVTTIMQKYWK